MTSGAGVGARERERLERHARLLFDLDAAGRIVAVNEPEADPPPRAWVARGDGGERLILGRADVGTDLLDQLADPAAAVALGAEGGPAFRFPERVVAPAVEGLIVVDRSTASLLAAHYPFTQRYLEVRSPVVGVVRDGAIVALCMSCRTGPDAGEVGLHTQEAWRGRGFGRALVARWWAEMRRLGREPFYSTTWSNEASLAVARALGLLPFAEELSVP
ncbi:MAG: GNAT family N-acetyltransferase [Chloroflexota bacterium]